MNEDTIRLRETLNKIIEEGIEIEGLKQSKAWEIIKRTLKAQGENYKADCFEAARKSENNLPNFLGRMEAIDWILDVVENEFKGTMERAIKEREAIELKELEENQINQQVNEIVNTVPYLGQRPGTI